MLPFNFGFWTEDAGGSGSVSVGGGVNTAWLTVSASTDWAVGTGDFTVEWFQYQTNNGNENFIFMVGSNSIGFSVASGGNRVNVYAGGGRVANPAATISLSTWYHVAISRTDGTMSLYFDGSRIANFADTTNINDSASTLFIGTQNSASPYGDNWPGNITNFRWTNGTGLYTGATITKPTRNLRNVNNTKLLLLFRNESRYLKDSSSLGKTVVDAGAPVWSSIAPF